MNISRCRNFVTGLFRNSAKKTEEVAKVVEQHKTEILHDPATGITKYTREFTNSKGNTCMIIRENQVLADGTVQDKTKVYGKGPNGYYFGSGDEGLRTSRTKTVKREKDASIMGGDKVTIKKEYDHTMAESARSQEYVKEFNKEGNIEHIEATRTRYGCKTEKAVLDKVYDGKNLPNSEKEIFDVYPSQHLYYKHSIDGNSNYYKFADEGETNFSRAITAREQAKIQLEAEKLAKLEAEKKAQEELQAKMPRMNLGKILGINPEELTMVEKDLGNGAIERSFTDANGKEVIKTFDQGILHREEVFSDKFDKLLFKQVGKEEPTIIAKKGNYTQIHRYIRDAHYTEEAQYYYDGVNSYKNGGAGSLKGCFSNAELRKPYYECDFYKKSDDRMKAIYDRDFDYKNNPYLKNDLAVLRSDNYGSSNELNEVHKEAQANYVYLKDLITPFNK